MGMTPAAGGDGGNFVRRPPAFPNPSGAQPGQGFNVSNYLAGPGAQGGLWNMGSNAYQPLNQQQQMAHDARQVSYPPANRQAMIRQHMNAFGAPQQGPF